MDIERLSEAEQSEASLNLLRGGLKMRHLIVAVAIDRCRSVVGAASVLNTSQPAVSRSLAQLEKIVGGRLFDRHARETAPTPLGRSFINHAKEMLGTLERAELEMNHIFQGGTARLAVGCNLSASIDLVPHAVILLQQRMPSTSITVREGSLESLLPDLRARRLDIIVARTEQSARASDLREIVLTDEPLVVVAAPDHPLSRKRKIQWKELEAVPWISAPLQSPVREGLERIFQLEGIEPLKTDVESVSSLANIHFMQELGAVTVMPRNVAQRFIQAGLASQLPITIPLVFRPLAAITLRTLENSDVINTFLTCLKNFSTDGPTNRA